MAPAVGANAIYGAQNSSGAAQRATQASQTPINPTSITPTNLDGFSAAATNVTAEKLEEQQPRNINELFTRVPGIIVINDDGSGHHGGLAIRGSPARRSRKVLVMEDGHPVNLALWLDPSVHYFAPSDRLEGVEVLRGTVITHGPNNNFGVVNVRNLSPFGPNETEIGAAIGFTRNQNGSFTEGDADDLRTIDKKDVVDLSARWHVHTRQTSGNVGIVLSYTGENVQGAWDNERLRFNDFYGAIGWKGIDQDLVVSVIHARQRDTYDELNFTGEDDDTLGAVEDGFFKVKHCKSCYAPASGLDPYYGEIWRGQMVHNLHLDKDTTITSRLYAGFHRRDRYQLISAEADPNGEPGELPTVDGDEVLFGEDTMFGRLRTFKHVGVETRAEFANRPFIGGMTQTIQTGIRFEHQSMSNRNFLGANGQILRDGDEDGQTIFDRALQSNAVSAFLQTSVKVAKDLSVVPGVRLEWYKARRRNRVVAGEESEAEEVDGVDIDPNSDCPAAFPEECLEIGDIDFDPARKRESTSSFRALPGLNFAYDGLYRTTIFGGYNRGLSTAVLRNEDFPAPDEIGDNFQLGFRSTAITGVALEVVGFHQRLKDFQFGASFSDAGDRTFGRADRVEINGIEVAGRVNSQPFTGGRYNVFAEGNYTYARGIIKKGANPESGDDFSGNDLPEVPFHVAALTLGVEQKTGWGWKWDTSVTWTYRGSFFTDESNTPFGGDPEGEDGEVPSVWLLSARANVKIGDTGASVFIAGDNLLDKLYITDREDGIKPGIGRTIWTGFKYKF